VASSQSSVTVGPAKREEFERSVFREQRLGEIRKITCLDNRHVSSCGSWAIQRPMGGCRFRETTMKTRFGRSGDGNRSLMNSTDIRIEKIHQHSRFLEMNMLVSLVCGSLRPLRDCHLSPLRRCRAMMPSFGSSVRPTLTHSTVSDFFPSAIHSIYPMRSLTSFVYCDDSNH
jgi:hypothetical protein